MSNKKLKAKLSRRLKLAEKQTQLLQARAFQAEQQQRYAFKPIVLMIREALK